MNLSTVAAVDVVENFVDEEGSVEKVADIVGPDVVDIVVMERVVVDTVERVRADTVNVEVEEDGGEGEMAVVEVVRLSWPLSPAYTESFHFRFLVTNPTPTTETTALD